MVNQQEQRNGNPPAGRSGIGDLFGVSQEGGAGFEPVKEFMYASSDFKELCARARIPKDLIPTIGRVLARQQRITTANTNMIDVIGNILQLSIGADGEARKEALQMVTGIAAARTPQFNMPPILNNLRTNKTDSREGPGQ